MFFILFYILYVNHNNNITKIYVLDVGQGSANLIHNSDGQNILIDGGPDNSVLSQIGEALPFYDKHISLVILSHPHLDHLYGLISIIENYKVDEVLMTGIDYQMQYYQIFNNLLLTKNIKVNYAEKAIKYKIDEDTYLNIIYPLKSLKGKVVENINNSSIVIQLVDQNIKILFPGDLEKTGEKELIQSNADLNSDVLVAGHHGSNTSSSREFLNKVTPDVVAISVGNGNKYKHPSESVIKLFNELNYRIFRTDLDGFIEIDSDGKDYKIKNPR